VVPPALRGAALTGPQAVLLLGVLAASWGLTRGVRAYALRTSMIDHPNPRGSHSTPTPRGGGLSIALSALTGLGLGGVLGWIPLPVTIALVGGGVLVAAIGWADDRHGIGAGTRLAVHFTAAAWALWWLGGFPTVDTPVGTIYLGVPGGILALFAVVWAINCYNFMDGIDGLAAGEATVVGLLGWPLLTLAGGEELSLVPLVIAAASAGFLAWNRPPARIFMGDVGSGLLGFLFGALAIASERAGHLPALAWVLLLGVFAVDASVTLLRRAARGERWYQAHRSHAYQRAVQSGWSHARVTGTALAITLVLATLVYVGLRWPGLRLATSLAALLGLTAIYVAIMRIWSRRVAEVPPPAP
jgi:Fuc2NAc and GlcNAc transferase